MSHVVVSEVHRDCEACGRSILPGGQHTRVDATGLHFFHAYHCPDPRCQPGTRLGQD